MSEADALGIPVEQVTLDLLFRASDAFLKHKLTGRNTAHVDILGYARQAADRFWEELPLRRSLAEGFRFGIAAWSHVKWRYKIDTFGDGRFRFVIYSNCSGEKNSDAIVASCLAIAADLTAAGFPTVVS